MSCLNTASSAILHLSSLAIVLAMTTALTLCIDLSNAHGFLSVPSSRGALRGVPEYLRREPVPGGLTGTDFVCRNQPAAAPGISVTAGGTLDVQWDFAAAHVGDCFFYLSYDTNAAAADMTWFKIAEYPDCRAQNYQTVSMNLPSFLPSSDHAVLRFEWYALHQVVSVEYYAQCVDIAIDGTNNALPANRYTLGNHLPASASSYRRAYEGQTFLVGPPLSTATNAMPGTSEGGPAPTPAPTPRPTSALTPAPTPAPTPTLTPAPTPSPSTQSKTPSNDVDDDQTDDQSPGTDSESGSIEVSGSGSHISSATFWDLLFAVMGVAFMAIQHY